MLRYCYYQFIIIIIVVVGSSCLPSARGDFSRTSSSKTIASDGCVNPRGDRGICKNIRDCPPLLSLLAKNKSRPNTRLIDFLQRSHCGFDGIHPIVCCPIDGRPKQKGSQRSGNSNKSSSTSSNHQKSCGAIQGLNKIVGGSVTSLTEFPWMVLIGYKTRHGLQYRCGGSLVSSRYVLTAAHCVSTLTDISPSSVRLGEYNLSTEQDCSPDAGCNSPPVDIAIEKLIPHPEYFKPELRNDIALIKLAEKVEFKESIRPICLPTNETISQRSSLGERAVVTGWGTTELGIQSKVLLKTSLPIVSLTECSEAYKRKIPITQSQICAGGEEGKDSCSGDSGGPLQVLGLNPLGQPAYVQQGIVSFGFRHCGVEGKPGVYTKVSSYTDWILKNLNE